MENKQVVPQGKTKCCLDKEEVRKVVAEEMAPVLHAIQDLTVAIRFGNFPKTVAMSVLKEINDHMEVQKIAESAIVVRESQKTETQNVVIPESPPRRTDKKRAARMSIGGRLNKKLNTRENGMKRGNKNDNKENMDIGNSAGDSGSHAGASSDGKEKVDIQRASESERESVSRYYEMMLRSYPGIRTDKDLQQEKRTGMHTGCSKCRKEAFDAAKGKWEFDKIFHNMVKTCSHVPLGEKEEDPLHW